MTARTPIASTVHEPHGKPGGPGAFGMKGAQFPAYIQHVAGELLKKGKSKSQAYQMAIGIVRNWAQGRTGKAGGKVSPQVQAAAAKAVAQYDALRSKAKATPNKGDKKLSVELATKFGASNDGPRTKSRDERKRPAKADEKSSGGGTPQWSHGWVPLNAAAKKIAAQRAREDNPTKAQGDAIKKSLMDDPSKDPEYQRLAAKDAKDKAAKGAKKAKADTARKAADAKRKVTERTRRETAKLDLKDYKLQRQQLKAKIAKEKDATKKKRLQIQLAKLNVRARQKKADAK